MKITFLREAEFEFLDAISYYERQQPNLGRRFKDEVDRSLLWLAARPEVCRLRPSGYRRMNLQVFPYYLPYIIRESNLWVLAVAHSRRRPEYWIEGRKMSAEKILSREKLLAERTRLRADGKTLVFTNGVFDLLHVGHVRYLAQARALGDALVVAINSDRTVWELKGDGRPLINELERAEILAALRQVTYVTVFDDVSPRSLIAALLPDALVKGGDYALDEIHGREEVEAAGGKVVSLPFIQGASTTAVIEKMKQCR